MAFCCSGSIQDAMALRPHMECRSLPSVPKSEADKLAERILPQMHRVDSEDTSMVACPTCGASFTWEGWDDGLYPWLRSHRHALD